METKEEISIVDVAQGLETKASLMEETEQQLKGDLAVRYICTKYLIYKYLYRFTKWLCR